MISLISFSAIAQQDHLKTVNGKLVNYGALKKFTTTDSTLSAVETVSILDNSAGMIIVTVVAADSVGDGVTGKIIYRYHKTAGTLTLASGTNISALVTDTGLGTATFTVTAVSNNVVLKCKGKLNYTVRWRTLVEQITP